MLEPAFSSTSVNATFRLAVRASDRCTEPDAVATLYRDLVDDLGAEPELVVAYHTTAGADALDNWLAEVEPPCIAGVTSCAQIMTHEAIFGGPNQPAVGLLGFSDPDGDYGAAIAPVDADPAAAARQAYGEALIDAGRPGELPELVMLHAATGAEEAAIEVIDELTGGSCPILGATCAKDGHGDEPTVFVGRTRAPGSVAVVACFPSRPVSTSFQSGYVPTGRFGHVTDVDGFTIHRIDGEPAAEVYSGWVDGAFDEALAEGDSRAFVESKTWCLGREIGQVDVGGDPVPYYALFDPGGVTDAKGLEVFVNLEQGQLVHLMAGDATSLPRRSAHVIESARADQMPDVSGAVVVFCAGYRFAPEVDLDEVRRSLGRALDGQPFLLTFAFGEQGSLLGGENLHGNLMVSAAVFDGPPHGVPGGSVSDG